MMLLSSGIMVQIAKNTFFLNSLLKIYNVCFQEEDTVFLLLPWAMYNRVSKT